MRKTPIDPTEFQRLKAIAKSVEPQIITTYLNNIFLESKSFDEGYIMLLMDGKKHRVSVAKSFFKDLSKVLNVTQTLRQSLSDNANEDNEFYSEFLDKLKDVQNAIGSIEEVTLLYDVIKKTFTRMNKGTFGKLTNESLFNFADALVNKYPELSIIDVIASDQSPNVNIKLLSKEGFDFSDLKLSSESEEFQFGVTLGNTDIKTAIGDFAYRLICTNGMMGLQTDERFTLPNSEKDGLHKLFQHFNTMKEANFLPADFAENFQNATQIHASLGELEKAYKLISKNLIFEYPEQENMLRDALSDTYFPDLKRVYARIKTKGYNPEKLEEDEKSFIRTGTSMWDLINTLTNLGSNDQGVFKFQNKTKFQQQGGQLLSSNWDLKNEKWLLL